MDTKKILTIVLTIVLVGGVVAAFFMLRDNTLSYIGVDINPSVQFITNSNDEVVGVTASNDDGEIILDGQIEGLMGMDVDEAVEKIVELSIEYGFLDPEALQSDPAAVSITTIKENGDVEEETQLRERVSNRIQNFFRNNGIYGVVLTDVDMEGVRLEAEDLGVNVAKYQLIQKVTALYPDLTEIEAADMKIRDLMEMLRDLGNEDATERRIEKRIDLVAHFEAKVTEMQAQIDALTETQTIKEGELTALQATDTTGFDQTQLDAHNLAISTLTTEIATLTTQIADLEAELTGLENALLVHEGKLEDLFVNRLQDRKQERKQATETAFNAWKTQRAQRAADMEDLWDDFLGTISEEEMTSILDRLDPDETEEN